MSDIPVDQSWVQYQFDTSEGVCDSDEVVLGFGLCEAASDLKVDPPPGRP